MARATLIILVGLASTGQYQVRNREVFRDVQAKLRDLREWDYRRTLRRLATLGLVSVRQDGEIDEISLLRAGEVRSVSHALGMQRVKTPSSAPKRYLVSFDIPERQRGRRKLLRDGLRELGFERVHQSLYAHGADCRNQVYALSASLGIEDRIKFLTSETVS